MSDTPTHFTPDDLQQWRFRLRQADDNNVFCHCRVCDREWIASSHTVQCSCGSQNVECLSCWQFPDD